MNQAEKREQAKGDVADAILALLTPYYAAPRNQGIVGQE